MKKNVGANPLTLPNPASTVRPVNVASSDIRIVSPVAQFPARSVVTSIRYFLPTPAGPSTPPDIATAVVARLAISQSRIELATQRHDARVRCRPRPVAVLDHAHKTPGLGLAGPDHGRERCRRQSRRTDHDAVPASGRFLLPGEKTVTAAAAGRRARHRVREDRLAAHRRAAAAAESRRWYH